MMQLAHLLETDYVTLSIHDTVSRAFFELINQKDTMGFVFDSGVYVGAFQPRSLVKKRTDFTSMKLSHLLSYPSIVHNDTTFQELISLFVSSQTTKLPVLDGERFVGVISLEAVLRQLYDESELHLYFIEEVKGLNKLFVNEHERIDSVLETMRMHHLDYIPVLDASWHVVGSVTHLDMYSNFFSRLQKRPTGHRTRISTKGFKPTNESLFALPISTVMQDKILVSIDHSASLIETIAVMLRHDLFYLQVKKEKQIVGVVSAWDVLELLDHYKQDFVTSYPMVNYNHTKAFN